MRFWKLAESTGWKKNTKTKRIRTKRASLKCWVRVCKIFPVFEIAIFNTETSACLMNFENSNTELESLMRRKNSFVSGQKSRVIWTSDVRGRPHMDEIRPHFFQNVAESKFMRYDIESKCKMVLNFPNFSKKYFLDPSESSGTPESSKGYSHSTNIAFGPLR